MQRGNTHLHQNGEDLGTAYRWLPGFSSSKSSRVVNTETGYRNRWLEQLENEDHKNSDLKHRRGNPESVKEDLQLLVSLKCEQGGKPSLTLGTQFIDNYINPSLLPWVHAVELSRGFNRRDRGG